MEFHSLLKQLVDDDGSDLYLATGAPPSAKFSGELSTLGERLYERGEVAGIANSILNKEQREEFETTLEMNLAVTLDGIGRFRLNMFKQRGEVSLVARNIQTEIPNFDDLQLPEILKDVITAKNGLVLFVGGTGSGKSTSLAALIDHRNSARGGHIITIEDPIEYVHTHKKCIVNQREVGVDTLSFHDALKNTLRQAPDVILIGEIRDRETMEHALAFAETGHLAISTLHANNANQALDRIINFFPEERRAQLLQDLGNNLRAFVSQRLVRTVDSKRCAAIEIMLGSHTIKQMIKNGQMSDIKETMQKSENMGMKTFDSALFDLVKAGRISTEEAIKNADSANNLRLRLKLTHKEEAEDEGELQLRGQLPSDIAAAKAAEESATGSDAQNSDNNEAVKQADNVTDIHAVMAAQQTSGLSTAEPAAAPPSPPSATSPSMELSLELEPEADSEEEPPAAEDEDDTPQFGMGKIG